MTGHDLPAEGPRAAADKVSCLACGTVYSKPLRTVGGVGFACPACGDAAWLALAVIAPSDSARSDASAPSAA
jgi:predicted RNA-binding Zn-ribbon protein involved in translation (DUF1610 family)